MANSTKRNQTFNFLYAMAILMVIDDHCSSRIGFMTSLFPYNSFYMPLFVFSSGYFFKRRGIAEELVHKSKKLLLPYLGWNLVAVGCAWVLDKLTGTDWIKKPTWDTLRQTVFHGSPTSLNGATWFVMMLFWVSVIYNLIRSIPTPPRKKYDAAATLVFACIGFVAVELCIRGYNSRGDWWLWGLRTVFYLQFYHYGYMFRLYGKTILHRCKRLAVCSCCIAVNVICILLYGDAINFYSTSGMGSFHVWYLPLVTSLSGILFYYEVMEYLARKIGQNSLVDFISRNTFVIMESHLLFANIPNFYAYFQALGGNAKYADFSIDTFRSSAWLRYTSDFRLMGFFCAVTGSLLLAFVLERAKKYLRKMQNK